MGDASAVAETPLTTVLSRAWIAFAIETDNDPAAALPRHPMVLHRGGWPDGS